MDQEKQAFYDQPVDHTPYGAFVWVISLAVIFVIIGSMGLWKAGSWYKGKRFLQDSNRTGATDALFEQGSTALDQAQAAAQAAADKAANDAKAKATQALLEQRDAAIKTAADAAQEEVKKTS
jgi:hypothetical protein